MEGDMQEVASCTREICSLLHVADPWPYESTRDAANYMYLSRYEN